MSYHPRTPQYFLMGALMTLGVSLLPAGSANAASVSQEFEFGCISTTTGCAIGAAQFSVLVSGEADGTGTSASFQFRNQGSGASTISEIYFDDGTLLGISSILNGTGVQFTGGSGTPPNLPDANNISPAFKTTAGFLADADSPPTKYGIDPGEQLTITFNLLSGFDIDDVIAAILSGTDLRIGIHAISIGSDKVSASFVNTTALDFVPVPLPASLVLLLSGLPLLSRFTSRRGRGRGTRDITA
jgi:hypothetical protein